MQGDPGVMPKGLGAGVKQTRGYTNQQDCRMSTHYAIQDTL